MKKGLFEEEEDRMDEEKNERKDGTKIGRFEKEENRMDQEVDWRKNGAR